MVPLRLRVCFFAGIMTAAAGILPAGGAVAEEIAEVVATMEPGQWRELPETSMRSVLPGRENHPHWGRQGPQAVTRAWSGAAYDTTRNRLILKGGGHGNYGGNEVYEFDLDTMAWTRATEPSEHQVDPEFSGKNSPNQFYRTADGTPVSRHTYDGLIYAPNVDRVFMWGGSLYSVGTSYDPHAWLYDVGEKTWSKGAETGSARIQVATAYDSHEGRILAEYGHGLYGYDPQNDDWSVISSRNDLRHGHVGAYDPQNRFFIQAQVPNSSDSDFAYYDLTDPAAGRRLPEVTGDTGFRDALVPGIAFHPPTGYMVLWEGWRQTWVLDPETWRIRKLENAPGPAPDHYGTDNYPVKGKYKTNGIYGRWAYVPDHDVFIGYGHVDDNVWLYRLPDNPFEWTAAADPVPCPADLCVGPDFSLSQPSQAARQAESGDTVAIQAGEYVDCARWPRSVTIRGLDGRPQIGGRVCNGKAVWITQGEDTLIGGVVLHGGSDGNRNGEGIRHEGKRLTVKDSVFHSNRMGILTNHGLEIELHLYNNEFHSMRSHSGLAHQVYAGQIGALTAEGNYFHESGVGHYIKSVAAENRITYNYLRNLDNAEAALIDVWGCSNTDIVGNILAYGGVAGALQGVSIVHRRRGGENLPCEKEPTVRLAYNTAYFEPTDQKWSSFVRNHFGVEYLLANNLVVNTRDLQFSGSGARTDLGQLTGNVHIEWRDDSVFVSPDEDDFRLARNIDEMAVPPLRPEMEYRHPAQLQEREDARYPGAHEFESE